MSMKEKSLNVLTNIIPDTLKIVDKKDLLKDFMNGNDEFLSASSWGKLVQHIGKKALEIDDFDEAYHFIIYSAYTNTLLFGAEHLEYTINNLAVPSSKKLDFSHEEFNIDKFSKNKLISYYKKVYKKILKEQLEKDEIKLLEKYINNNLKYNYFKILEENPLVLNKYIKHIQSDIFKERHKSYEKTLYEQNISKEYTDIVLNDQKGLTLKDLYIKPNFRVHKNCFYEDDDKVEKLSYKDTKLVECSNDDIHKFILDTLDGKNELKLDRKDINTIFISGFPGQGKSSFVKKFVYDVINNKTALEKDVLLIKLKNIKNNQALKNESIEKVIKDNIPFEIENLDDYIVVLDGLDELYMKSGLKLEDIDQVCGKLSEASFTTIVTTRHHYVDFDKLNESNILVLELKELSLEQQINWLDKYKKVYPNKKLSKELLEELHNNKDKNRHIIELINQPILLHMIADMDIEDIGELDKSKLYEKFFDILINRNWEKTQHPLSQGIAKDKYKKLLRDMLQELAYNIFISDHEYIHKIDFEELKSVERLKSELSKVQDKSLENGLKGVMIAFYFQEVHKNSKDKNKKELEENYAIEFLHKSLMEYMVAEYIFKEIKRFIGKDTSTEDYTISCGKEALKLIWELFSSKQISEEVVDNLNNIVRYSNSQQKDELFNRLESFTNYFLEHDYIYDNERGDSIKKGLDTFYGYWCIISKLKDNFRIQNNDKFMFFIRENLNKRDIQLSFSNSLIRRNRFENINTRYADFSNSNLISVRFHNCNISFPKFKGASLVSVNFINFRVFRFYLNVNKFTRSSFLNSFLSNIRTYNLNISFIEFKSSEIRKGRFINSIFKEVFFKNTILKEETVFHNVEFIDCKFEETIFYKVKFYNCKGLETLKRDAILIDCEFIEEEESHEKI